MNYNKISSPIFLITLSFLLLSNLFVKANEQNNQEQKTHFHQALDKIEKGLNGTIKLSYEEVIFIIENAYWGGEASYEAYQKILEAHQMNINYLIKRNDQKKDFPPTFYNTEEELKALYQKALANEAIFYYMTDTNYFIAQNNIYASYPFTYSYNDPLGTINWENTQVINLLNKKEKRGNCFALASLFKIFSDRLNSDASLCTAPGHIYIRHEDHKGTKYNVELATQSFPGTGSLETLTYTTDEATKNNISLRTLTDKQAIATCLVYLAKGYQHKFNIVEDDFMLQCAEIALKHDDLNLNAMRLKAEIEEQRLIDTEKSIAQLQKDHLFLEYQENTSHLYDLGYREMPLEMKNIVLAGLKNEPLPIQTKDHTPKAFVNIDSKDTRYATLSWGLFEEVHRPKPTEKYHRTLFDTKTKKVIGFTEEDTLYNKYPMDMVVFAWSVDPLASKYPQLSPYTAFANNPILFVDADGREISIKDPNTGKVSIFKPGDQVPDGSSQFVQGVYASLNYLYANGGETSINLIDDLVNDDGFKVTVSETRKFGSGETSYSPKLGIAFNPYEGLIVGGETEGNNQQSPSLGLLHELDHANRHRQLLSNLNDAKAGGNRDKIKSAKAAINEFFTGDAEEERVISGVERTVANTLGEGFRNSYDDVKGIFKAKGPTSTETGTTTKKEQRQINKTNKLLNIEK